MNTFQIHTQLGEAVRAAAVIRAELSRNPRSLSAPVLYLRLGYLQFNIDSLIWRLRKKR